MTDQEGMRLGELEGIVGRGRRLLGRKRRRHPPPGPRHPRRPARAQDGRAPGRPEGARAPRPGALRPPAGAVARRADEPPRPRLDPLAARVPRPLRRHAHRHLARPPFPERGLHAHGGHRLPDDHSIHRRLRRHGAREDADPIAHRGGQRPAREEDRAAERLHRALLGRHARQPGDVAPEGSRAAADQRPRAVEHPAALHQVHHAATLGASRARVLRRHQDARLGVGRLGLQRHRQPRREDRAGRAGTASARRRCSRRSSRRRIRRLARRATSTAARSGGATRCRSATSRRTTPARSRRA